MKNLHFFLIFWLLLCGVSYSQKDLNLTIFNYPFLSNFQEMMVYVGYYQRVWATVIFGILMLGLYYFYWQILISKLDFKFSFHLKYIVSALIFIVASLFAYPMFSHDIFNYLFNAKMVLVYGQDPHIHTALEFPNDLWIRFMHNVHTPAPYAYGWTAISLVPLFLTISNFTLSLLSMKAFIILAFLGEVYFLYKLAEVLKLDSIHRRMAMLALSPMLLMETFIMGHNDSVMMFFLVLSLYCLEKWKLDGKKGLFIWGFLAFGASVFIKYATVVLLPLMVFRYFVEGKKPSAMLSLGVSIIRGDMKKFFNSQDLLYSGGGLLLWAIIFSRPDQVHSWYFHWGIVLLVLSRSTWLQMTVVLLSFGGMIRYLPYVYYGNWDYPVTVWRWVLLFLPLIFLVVKKWRMKLKV